jgi:hypothetical protein
MWNPVEFQGVVGTVAGADLTITGAAFAANQFNGAGNAHFVEVITGANAGIMSDIVATGANSVTLSQDLAAMISAGDSIRIRAHHTIGSVFGAANEFGFTADNLAASADVIQVLGAGSFYYAPSGGPNFTGGWVDIQFGDAANTVLYPDQGIVVRRIGTDPVDVKLLGAVKEGPTAITVESGFSLVANVYPTDVSLDASALDNIVVKDNAAAAADNIRIQTTAGGGFETFYYAPAGGPNFNGGWVDVQFGARGGQVVAAGSSFIFDRRGAATNWVQPQPF